MLNYKKIMLILCLGASLSGASVPVFAAGGDEVPTTYPRQVTQDRYSRYQQADQERTAVVESLESKAKQKASRHHKKRKIPGTIESGLEMTETGTENGPVSERVRSILDAERVANVGKRPAGVSKTEFVTENVGSYKPQFLLPGNYQEVTIFGPALATEQQAVALLHIINPHPKLTCTPKEIVHYYWQEAEREGIRPDVAFAQAILESGSFRFGGDVLPEQNNFCGLGTVGGGVKGARFKTPELGARAHIQHLLAYTDKRPGTKIIDPRYELAHKVRQRDGFCTTWYQLNGNWATSKYYAEKILTVWQRMLGYKDLAGVKVESDVLAYGRQGK